MYSSTVQQMVHACDMDHDGKLNSNEFQQLLHDIQDEHTLLSTTEIQQILGETAAMDVCHVQALFHGPRSSYRSIL